MAVERYRDAREMPRPPRPEGRQLLDAIAAVWERAHVRGVSPAPRGVVRYRSLEEAQHARRERTLAWLRRLRAMSV